MPAYWTLSYFWPFSVPILLSFYDRRLWIPVHKNPCRLSQLSRIYMQCGHSKWNCTISYIMGSILFIVKIGFEEIYFLFLFRPVPNVIYFFVFFDLGQLVSCEQMGVVRNHTFPIIGDFLLIPWHPLLFAGFIPLYSLW